MAGLRRAVFYLLYCLGVLAFLEGSSRAALSFDWIFARVLGNDESSFRLAWVHRGDIAGIAYAFDQYHPVRGWTLSPSLRDIPVFGDRTLSTNSKGLRGSQEFSYEKPAGRKRVLVFGDSFTFGEEVSDGETYAAALGRALPDADVLNMGVHGYGHDQMLLYFEEEGRKYSPDLVVLGFLPYDMERNILAFRDFAKPLFVRGREGLVLTHTPVPSPERVRRGEFYRSKFWDLLTILVQRSEWASGRNDTAMKAVTEALLDRFRGSVEGAKARCLFAYLPVWHEMDVTETPTDGEAFLENYCRSRGADCIDLRPLFLERERKGDHFKTSGHWNRREHQAAADFLSPRIAALLPR
jgi:hypothetical protein